VAVLLVTERPRCGDADPIRSVLDVAEDGALRPCLVPLEADTVCLRRVDDQIIYLHKRRELVLEGIIRQRQRYRKKNQAAGEVLAFIERKDFPAPVSMW
jgi:hypothetical protein